MFPHRFYLVDSDIPYTKWVSFHSGDIVAEDSLLDFDGDLLKYMNDSLQWVHTLRLDGQYAPGLDLRGVSIIDGQYAMRLAGILDSWKCLFENAPQEEAVVLTGDDNHARLPSEIDLMAHAYIHLEYDRQYISDRIGKIVQFCNQVHSGGYYILHLAV